jgi:phospholipase A1
MRIKSEYDSLGRDFVITTHQPNYFMVTHNGKTNQQYAQEIIGEEKLDDEEVQFQISIKFPLIRNAFSDNDDIYFGFTTTSWWQMFNGDISSPFRETNYEPEVFWRYFGGPSFWRADISGFDLALVHESNGRGAEVISRSWNRAMLRTVVDMNDLAIHLRAWYRFPEDAEDDDNPNMYRYYGYGDVRAIWVPNRNTFTAMFRPGTEKNALELTWSYPISKNLRIYTQYFNGYGESLIDYNARTERIGIGIALNDFLQRP